MTQQLISWFKLVQKYLRAVIYQNAVTLVNGIFAAVVLLLLVFGQGHEALFLGSVLILNVSIGIIQDLRAKVALERLQILMTPRVIRVNMTSEDEEVIQSEDIVLGDTIALQLGDQVPADGVLVRCHGLELNEALITGESHSLVKKEGDRVLAGSIVTAGSGVFQVMLLPRESFVAKMTDKIKQFSMNLSPIQRTLSIFIRYMTYLLIVVVIYVIVRGLTVHDLVVSIVKEVAALTGTLVPQGLVLSITVFFAYGAIQLFEKEVLLQEINATEKLGRIKNLCIDKTGTLTENHPFVESVVVYDGYERDIVDQLSDAYISGSRDASEMGKAIEAVLHVKFSGKTVESVPFSSTRKYGITSLVLDGKERTVFVGAPDVLIKHMKVSDESKWLQALVDQHSSQAKRLVVLAEAVTREGTPVLEGSELHPVALFVLSNPLRSGTAAIIDFFQKRGVRIRVISGDNPQTVQAIAAQAGISHNDMIITGSEMESWDDEAYDERVPAFHLFARITPEQKERIIQVLKRSGFTAMIGDGANDALAIKKADLGIAMFNGAQATRQIAQVVLMNNSFSALPNGVAMAETIITSIEMVAGVFFNSVVVGLMIFVGLAFLGYPFPISPRNITVINYFTIGLPLLYLAIFPAHKMRGDRDQQFLRTLLPFALVMGLTTAIAATTVFSLSPEILKESDSNVLVVLVMIFLGFWFFILAPGAYEIVVDERQRRILKRLVGAVFVLPFFFILMPGLSDFFGLEFPGIFPVAITLVITGVFGWLQYKIAQYWPKFARVETQEGLVRLA
jgi:cation-transporting ATPase E